MKVSSEFRAMPSLMMQESSGAHYRAPQYNQRSNVPWAEMILASLQVNSMTLIAEAEPAWEEVLTSVIVQD